MKKPLLALLLAAASLVLTPAAQAQSPEHEAVHQAMKQLLRAFESGDPNLVWPVLRRDALVLGYSTTRKQVMRESGEEWAKGFQGRPAEDEAQRKRSYEILDVSGNAALVKVHLDYPRWQGMDYLALAKIDGAWMIVSKSWSGQRR